MSDLNTAWDESKLVKMIQDGIEESLTTEYKAAAALGREPRRIADITKDVSAMANSAGGALIYGISQHSDPTRQHLPERIVPVSRNEFSKEWLEHVIAQIRPRIPELRIQSVQLASGSDDVVYVIEIPQGTTAHQATDYRYYRRHNFEAVPMLDHEVRDVMNRKTHPRVAIDARFVVYPHKNSDERDGALIVSIKNETDVFARYVALVVHSPIKMHGKFLVYDSSIVDNGDHGQAYRLLFSNHLDAPLFPQGTLKALFMFRFADRISPVPEKQLDHFRWVVFADSMPMQRGVFSVEEICSK